MLSRNDIPIQTLRLFPILDKLLIDLLRSLSKEEWNLPTVARLWTVKDIASHLLDGNLKGLSTSRDNYFGEKPKNIDSYTDLVAFINASNLHWTNITKRLSPEVLTELLETTGKQYSAHLETLDPFAPAIFSVAWAGQDSSENWFHTAREYSEKFIHQQQIREAVGRQALFTKELFYPFMDICMQGLPYTYREVIADNGTTIKLTVAGTIGGSWSISRRNDKWELSEPASTEPLTEITLTPDIAWQLFSKSLRPSQIMNGIMISGDEKMANIALTMVSVMA